MPLLANCLITTARGTFNATSKVTGPPAGYLTGVSAAVEPMQANSYTLLPTAAGASLLGNDYVVRLDSGVDVQTGDRIINCMLLDGVTPYPPEVQWAGVTQPGVIGAEYWEVSFAQEESPFPLPERTCYVKRVRLKGPVVG